MKSCTILVVLSLLTLVDSLEPMLCQRDKGMRIYKRDYKLNCTETNKARITHIKLRVPSYKQQTASGHWNGLYQQTCTTHYFFWGSYTSKSWHEPLELTLQQKEDLSKGMCPSLTHATPLLHHIPDHCTYTWPTQTEQKTLYCITRATTVRQIVGQPLTSDEEALIPSSIKPGFAETVTGAIVIWNEADLHDSDKSETRYEGPAFVTGDQVIVEALQEGFLLTNKLANDTTDDWSTWNIVEGFLIKLPRQEKTRFKTDELSALQSELNTKLQYATNKIENTLQLARKTCLRQNQLRDTIETSITQDADKYAQSIFNTTYVTAVATHNYLFVWPCKAVMTWSAYH